MSRVFIIGANGGIGRRLLSDLSGRGHQAMAFHRAPEQAADLKARGATPVLGDLTKIDIDILADQMSGSDVVVFSAGAGGKGGPEMTNAIDGDGLRLAVDAALKAGVRRFLLVSAFPEAGRGKAPQEGFENYMRVKKLSDAYLVASGLDYVILRPALLLDSAGTGKVHADLAIGYGEVPRDDVAATLAEIIDTPDLGRRIIELTSGDTPIADAVKRLAR